MTFGDWRDVSYGIWEETPGESQGLNEIFSSLRGSMSLTRIYAGWRCVVVDSCCSFVVVVKRWIVNRECYDTCSRTGFCICTSCPLPG